MPMMSSLSRPLAAVVVPIIVSAGLIAIGIEIRSHVLGHVTTDQLRSLSLAMPSHQAAILGATAGGAAGLLAGLIGIGGGIVVVPVVYYGLLVPGTSPDQAAHVAVGTSLAAILPAALVSSFVHWRAGHTDFAFLRAWGPGIAAGVVAGQLAAPHIPGSLMTGIFAVLCLVFSVRFAVPGRFHQITAHPPEGLLRNLSGGCIGLFSGLAGVGGGIMTNIVMTLSGMSMHKSVGRAAAVGVVVSVPATIVAALGSGPHGPAQLGSIDLTVWACIAPAQAVAAWFGAHLARHVGGDHLSRIVAAALLATGATMLSFQPAGWVMAIALPC